MFISSNQILGELIEVFFVYHPNPRDEKIREDLEKHLAPLWQTGRIAIWYDKQLSAGKVRASEIKEHLEKAHLFLILVSADFVASNYFRGSEMKRARERHNSREAHIIPIIARPVLLRFLRDTPFDRLQVLPKNEKPIKDWAKYEQALLNVTDGICEVVEEIAKDASIDHSGDSKEALHGIKPSKTLPIFDNPISERRTVPQDTFHLRGESDRSFQYTRFFKVIEIFRHMEIFQEEE